MASNMDWLIQFIQFLLVVFVINVRKGGKNHVGTIFKMASNMDSLIYDCKF